jgi:hypothetical protein
MSGLLLAGRYGPTSTAQVHRARSGPGPECQWQGTTLSFHLFQLREAVVYRRFRTINGENGESAVAIMIAAPHTPVVVSGTYRGCIGTLYSLANGDYASVTFTDGDMSGRVLLPVSRSVCALIEGR